MCLEDTSLNLSEPSYPLQNEKKTNVLIMAAWQGSVQMTPAHAGGDSQGKEASMCPSLLPSVAPGGKLDSDRSPKCQGLLPQRCKADGAGAVQNARETRTRRPNHSAEPGAPLWLPGVLHLLHHAPANSAAQRGSEGLRLWDSSCSDREGMLRAPALYLLFRLVALHLSLLFCGALSGTQCPTVLNKYLGMVLLKWPQKLRSTLEQTPWDSASEATSTCWASVY